jgi:hypothetical protein
MFYMEKSSLVPAPVTSLSEERTHSTHKTSGWVGCTDNGCGCEDRNLVTVRNNMLYLKLYMESNNNLTRGRQF